MIEKAVSLSPATERKKRSSLGELTASVATALGIVLGLTALMMMPICWIEGWNGNLLVSVMLVLSAVCISAACHYMDRREAARKAIYRESPKQ